MSAPDAAPATPVPIARRATQRYGTIIVMGGGCYGSYYVRQLARAHAAGAIIADRVLVVDRDAQCAVAREHPPNVPVEFRIAEWARFLDEYLGAACAAPDVHASDAIVPSPLMPHLTAQWLLARAHARWPGREARLTPLERAPAVPWERAGEDGTHYASFATWMCPINCVEPARCPHTRGPRDWSMPTALASYATGERAAGRPVAGVFTFHCEHRAYGVGMFDVRVAVDADAAIAREASSAPAAFLVASASHCHGAIARLLIGPPA